MPGRRKTGGRERGFVRKRGNSYQVLVYEGVDPVTGKDSYLTESTRDDKKVPEIRSRLLAKVDRQRTPQPRPPCRTRWTRGSKFTGR